jgi:hypothetical protein
MNKLTDKEYQIAKDSHDCRMSTHGYCQGCEDIALYESYIDIKENHFPGFECNDGCPECAEVEQYETDFIKDKMTLIQGELL